MNSPSAAEVRPGASLWSYVGKLLRLRWLIFFNSFRRAKLRGKIGTIILALVVIGGMALAFWLSWLLLDFMRSPELSQYLGNASAFITSVPVVVVSAAFLGILITSFGLLLQALYLAGDMEFLLSAPIPIRAVFITKLLQAILPNFGLILLFSLPVLYGMGLAYGYTMLYYPLVLVVLALLALCAAGLASLLVMLVVRVFPARRVAEILGFLVAILSLTCSQSGNLFRFSDVSGDQALQGFSMLSRLNTPYSPLAWAGRSLVAIGEGHWLIGLGLVLLTIVLTGGIFALSLVTAERLYYSGWARVQVSTRTKKAVSAPRRAPTQSSGLSVLVARLIPRPVSAIITKDFMVLRRDLRNMSQLVTPLILGVVYAFMLLRSGGEPPAGRGEAPPEFMEAMRSLLVYANVGISLFVSWSLISRLGGMGFSAEGKSYWMLKASPIGTRQLLAAKYLVAFLPTLLLGWGFLLVISLVQRAPLGTMIFSLAVVALTIAGTAGLNLAFGVAGANFDWEDPRRISMGSIGCLGGIVNMAFLLVSLALFFGPLLLVRTLGGPAALGQALGLVIGGAASLAVAFVPLWLVRQRVPRLAEG
jgi:ABC-2 type transport system permease protein